MIIRFNLIAVMFLSLSAGAVFAAEEPKFENRGTSGDGQSTFGLSQSQRAELAGRGQSGSTAVRTGSASAPEPAFAQAYRELSSEPDGTPCLVTRTAVAYSDAEIPSAIATIRAANARLAGGPTAVGAEASVVTPGCTSAPGAPGAPLVDPGQVLMAAMDVASVHVPVPEPSLQPAPETLAGFATFLDTGRPLEARASDSFELFGRSWPVTFEMDGTYNVDWGDGEVRYGVAFPGSGWRDPDLRHPQDLFHVWTHVGTYDVAIIDTWTVTATVPGIGARTATFAMPATTIPLEVGELRSVRLD